MALHPVHGAFKVMVLGGKDWCCIPFKSPKRLALEPT